MSPQLLINEQYFMLNLSTLHKIKIVYGQILMLIHFEIVRIILTLLGIS